MTYAKKQHKWLAVDEIHLGDCRELIPQIEPESVALSVWSPPYFVGKSYEAGWSFEEWQALLSATIRVHFAALKPGGFLAINIADILCFRDPQMPRIQLANVSKHRSPITREMVIAAKQEHPEMNRDQLAALLGCSEQTIDRRTNGNNIRGGKYETQTRVKLVGGMIEQWGLDAGLFLYDRRVWIKDPCWANGQWHSSSYRSVDEFEYIYLFWKPGETVVDRGRLQSSEWATWGSRGAWRFASVRANQEHEAQFPLELPLRLIRLLTVPGDVVLDCFMGSGTTAVACVQTDRHYIGCELLPHYRDLARRNVQRAIAEGVQGALFSER
jgi:site-specific DNA-methyltransferase (adenine-specific)